MQELIDTLWNVNCIHPTSGQSRSYRINRYIMECKYIFAGINESNKMELIDTLWNVNQGAYMPFVAKHRELIDTLWNVNNKKAKEISGRLQELIDTLWNVNTVK